MTEEERQLAVRSIVRTHLERLVREYRWRQLVDGGEQAAAEERLVLAWYEIKADLMLRRVGARRSEVLGVFEEVLLPEYRERYHDIVAYDPELPRPPEEEGMDETWVRRIQEVVEEAVAPLKPRLAELASRPWQYLPELELAFASILSGLQKGKVRGVSRVILETLGEELAGVPLPFLWGVLVHEARWTRIAMPAVTPVAEAPAAPMGVPELETVSLAESRGGEPDPGPPRSLRSEDLQRAWSFLLSHRALSPAAFHQVTRDVLDGWQAACKDEPMAVHLWAYVLHRLASQYVDTLERQKASAEALLVARHLRAALAVVLAQSEAGVSGLTGG